MKNSARGFTLIELIVVILILGILAATALPRFMSAQTDARIAKAQALFGSVRAASSLAKARCELDLGRGLVAAGTCGNATPQVTMDGSTVDITNRYPSASNTGIIAAAQLNAASDNVTIAGATPLTIQVVGATTPANCVVSYTAAPANGSPTITVTTTGC